MRTRISPEECLDQEEWTKRQKKLTFNNWYSASTWDCSASTYDVAREPAMDDLYWCLEDQFLFIWSSNTYPTIASSTNTSPIAMSSENYKTYCHLDQHHLKNIKVTSSVPATNFQPQLAKTNYNSANDLQSNSDTEGQTWTPPHHDSTEAFNTTCSSIYPSSTSTINRVNWFLHIMMVKKDQLSFSAVNQF